MWKSPKEVPIFVWIDSCLRGGGRGGLKLQITCTAEIKRNTENPAKSTGDRKILIDTTYLLVILPRKGIPLKIKNGFWTQSDSKFTIFCKDKSQKYYIRPSFGSGYVQPIPSKNSIWSKSETWFEHEKIIFINPKPHKITNQN